MEQTIYQPHTGNEFLADVMLSCPFCGKEPQLTFIGNDYSKKREVQITCQGCRVTLTNAGIRSGSEQLAKWSIEAWNKRVSGKQASRLPDNDRLECLLRHFKTNTKEAGSEADNDRLEWLLRHLSGSELRRLGLMMNDTGDLDELKRLIIDKQNLTNAKQQEREE